MGNFTDIEVSTDTDFDPLEESAASINEEHIIDEGDLNQKLVERRRKIEERNEMHRLKEEWGLYDDDL
ncbi:MAG: hypothetical protein ACI92E_002981 [Oceanicoccus sp.]|jgi:hypothetical protein